MLLLYRFCLWGKPYAVGELDLYQHIPFTSQAGPEKSGRQWQITRLSGPSSHWCSLLLHGHLVQDPSGPLDRSFTSL